MDAQIRNGVLFSNIKWWSDFFLFAPLVLGTGRSFGANYNDGYLKLIFNNQK
jgi:hypothetical protein